MDVANKAVRQATPSDIPELVDLINRAFVVTRRFRQGDRTNPAQVQEMMNSGTFLMLENERAMVACVYLRLTGSRAYLGTLSVDPAQQRRGIGTRMMHEAEEYCRAAGCTAVDIRIVNVRTELPAIYHKFGFVETGTQSAEAIKDATMPIHFIIMSKAL